MKLEKYLADYLATGIERLHEQGLPMDFTVEGLQEVIKQGLNAFESTECADILIIPHNPDADSYYWKDQ